MSCPELAPPEFGAVQLEARNVNDTAKFTCNSGYDLVGAEAVTCVVINEVASWSHLSPTCQRKVILSLIIFTKCRILYP